MWLTKKHLISISLLSSLLLISGCNSTTETGNQNFNKPLLTTIPKTEENNPETNKRKLNRSTSPKEPLAFDEERAKTVEEQQISSTIKKFYYIAMKPNEDIFSVIGGALLQQTFTNQNKPIPDNIVEEIYQVSEREGLFDIIDASKKTKTDAAESMLIFGITALDQDLLKGEDKKEYDFDIEIDISQIEVYGNKAFVPNSAIEISNFTVNGETSELGNNFDYIKGDINMKRVEDTWKIISIDK